MSKLTSNDAAFLISVFKNMESQPRVDWAAVMGEMGLKNIKTTQTRYGQIKRKLQPDAASPPTNKRSRSPTNDGDAQQQTPDKISPFKRSKKKTGPSAATASHHDKGRGGRKIKVEDLQSEPDDDSEEYMDPNDDDGAEC